MLKLEQQVCSLELAKRLKELGVKQESLYYFVNPYKKDGTVNLNKYAWVITRQGNDLMYRSEPNVFSAFTVAELVEQVPTDIEISGKLLNLRIRRDPQYGYAVILQDENGRIQLGWSWGMLADQLAKMLIYLLENKLITP